MDGSQAIDGVPSPRDELLQQLEERLDQSGDPMHALMDLLDQRQAARRRLFDLGGGSVLGFRLERVLGAGGMGVTYAGRAPYGARAAIKLVAGLDGAASERFEQECRVLRSLDHAAIVRYRDHALLPDGTGVLVMDLVDGLDLERLLTGLGAAASAEVRRTAMVERLLQGVEADASGPWRDARFRRRMLRLLAEVADGLHAAHEHGVVHRDVKPANILVHGDLSPVLIDFGLARDVLNKVSFTQSGMALGTLAYMAPEQMGRDPGAVDRRTDVYGLGLVLYRAMTGQDLRQDIGAAVRSQRRAFLLDARQSRELPVDVQAILYRCLDPRPGRRYPTARALAEDLRAAAGQGKVSAVLPSLALRTVRNPRKLAAIVALLSVTTALAVWAGWPRGRDVVFAANCDPGAGAVLVDGTRRAWLGDRIWLPFGPHRVELTGAEVRTVARTFDLEPGRGPMWVTLLTHHLDAENLPRDKALGHVMTGYQWQPIEPQAPRDRVLVDGREERAQMPMRIGPLLPGRYQLRAIDGKGREETQSIDVDVAPFDVQMLPAVLAGVDGSFRCTWSTVLSPRPAPLSVESVDAVAWSGALQPSMFGGGLQRLRCAFAPGEGGAAARVRLRCALPAAMRSAVVYLRGRVQAGGELRVQAGFAGEPRRSWPLRADGQLEPLQEFVAAAGSAAFELEAELRSDASPTGSLALVQFCEGMVFGGHWHDEPPAFAIVADPGDRARLTPVPAPAPRASPLELATEVRPLDGMVPGSRIARAALRAGPGGQRELWLGIQSLSGGPAWIERRTWPDLRLSATLRPQDFRRLLDSGDGGLFGMYIVPVPDRDGDGWEEMLVGDPSASRLGELAAGEVRLVTAGPAPVIWPQQLTAGTFHDDRAGTFCAAGDWNDDGYPDLACSAPAASVSASQPKSGVTEVIDGRTFAKLWRQVGPSLSSRQLCAWSGTPPAKGPAPLLFVDHIRVGEVDRADASRYVVWSGGLRGVSASTGLLTPCSSAGLVQRESTGELALLVARGPSAVYPEMALLRFAVVGDALTLTHQVVGSGLSVDFLDGRSSFLGTVPDLDGDGWPDAASLCFEEFAGSVHWVCSGGNLAALTPSGLRPGWISLWGWSVVPAPDGVGALLLSGDQSRGPEPPGLRIVHLPR